MNLSLYYLDSWIQGLLGARFVWMMQAARVRHPEPSPTLPPPVRATTERTESQTHPQPEGEGARAGRGLRLAARAVRLGLAALPLSSLGQTRVAIDLRQTRAVAACDKQVCLRNDDVYDRNYSLLLSAFESMSADWCMLLPATLFLPLLALNFSLHEVFFVCGAEATRPRPCSSPPRPAAPRLDPCSSPPRPAATRPAATRPVPRAAPPRAPPRAAPRRPPCAPPRSYPQYYPLYYKLQHVAAMCAIYGVSWWPLVDVTSGGDGHFSSSTAAHIERTLQQSSYHNLRHLDFAALSMRHSRAPCQHM